MRVARSRDGSLAVGRVAPGRGAWLCRDPDTGLPMDTCFHAASSRNGFAKAFRTRMAVEVSRSLFGGAVEVES